MCCLINLLSLGAFYRGHALGLYFSLFTPVNLLKSFIFTFLMTILTQMTFSFPFYFDQMALLISLSSRLDNKVSIILTASFSYGLPIPDCQIKKIQRVQTTYCVPLTSNRNFKKETDTSNLGYLWHYGSPVQVHPMCVRFSGRIHGCFPLYDSDRSETAGPTTE